MKRSDVNVQTLLNQLSEEKINLVVDQELIRGGASSDKSSKYSSKCTDSHDSNSASECGDGGTASGGGGILIGTGGGICIGL
jgi:hypothetical protein